MRKSPEPKRTDLLKVLDRVPPCVCRLLARTASGRRALTHKEIADRSGLSESYVGQISRKNSWKDIPVSTVERFASGCGVNLFRPADVKSYVKRRGGFITKGSPSRAKMLKALLVIRPPQSPSPPSV